MTDTHTPYDIFTFTLVVSSDSVDKKRSEIRSLTDDDTGYISLPSGNKAVVEIFDNHSQVIERLCKGPVDAVLLDNRQAQPPVSFSDSVAGNILPELLAACQGRSGKRSILVILPQFEATAHHAYAIGSLNLGGIIVDPADLKTVLDLACKNARPHTPGKVALCLAGGGIEGMFYELGVLQALDAHLFGRSVVDFDIVSGISAGALLGAFLANGIRPQELVDAMHGKNDNIATITRAMLFDPNVGEMAGRIWTAVTDMAKGRWLVKPIDSALKVAPNALFSGDKLRTYLEKEMSKPGRSNDFRLLKKKFFVGTTDQDTGSHVTFGEQNYDDVSISSAVRASAAMTPYYPPEKIKGRYFIDGIFTRTINIDVAVAHGAKLIICIDPLAPVQTEQAGYVSGRGGIFNTVQSVKSMIRTRFSEVIDRAEEAYPDVSVYVFSPTAKDMEQMSGTMMNFFFNPEIATMAFESACGQIDGIFEWLQADLTRHGFMLRRRN